MPDIVATMLWHFCFCCDEVLAFRANPLLGSGFAIVLVRSHNAFRDGALLTASLLTLVRCHDVFFFRSSVALHVYLALFSKAAMEALHSSGNVRSSLCTARQPGMVARWRLFSDAVCLWLAAFWLSWSRVE